MSVDRFVVTVAGRPAPQGSKKFGAHGQMREQSAYLPAWRAAVIRDVYREYRRMGVTMHELPLFVGPVAVVVAFALDTGQRIDGPPDLDKLLRSTFDALTQARVWEDDGRVVDVRAQKIAASLVVPMGADITVWAVVG